MAAPDLYTYVKSNFGRELSDEAIEVMAAFAPKNPSLHTFAPFVEHWHRAATRVGATDTAFPHRNYKYQFYGVVIVEECGRQREQYSVGARTLRGDAAVFGCAILRKLCFGRRGSVRTPRTVPIMTG